MTNNEVQNTSSPSTAWEWKRVKKRSGSAPAGDSPTAGRSSQPRRKRDGHLPMTIQIRYRGGPSCAYLIEYRGTCLRFDGFEAIHDVMQIINGQVQPWER